MPKLKQLDKPHKQSIDTKNALDYGHFRNIKYSYNTRGVWPTSYVPTPCPVSTQIIVTNQVQPNHMKKLEGRGQRCPNRASSFWGVMLELIGAYADGGNRRAFLLGMHGGVTTIRIDDLAAQFDIDSSSLLRQTHLLLQPSLSGTILHITELNLRYFFCRAKPIHQQSML